MREARGDILPYPNVDHMGAGGDVKFAPITRVLLTCSKVLPPLQGSPAPNYTLNIARADDGGSNSMYAG